MKTLPLIIAFALSACASDAEFAASLPSPDWINRCVAYKLDVPVKPLPLIRYVDHKLQDPDTGKAVDGIYVPIGAGLIFVVDNLTADLTLMHELKHHYGMTHGEMLEVSAPPLKFIDRSAPIYLAKERRELQSCENFYEASK